MPSGICEMASTEYCHKHKDCYECGHGRKVFTRLAAYEDAIPFPDLPRAAELIKADDKGLCVVLPCEVGSTVYTIVENYFECENCEHGDEAQDNKIVGRVCCVLTGGRHCPYRIKGHVVGGFEVSQNEETGKLFLSAPGMWGCEGLKPFVGVDGCWYPTRSEAEAALADRKGVAHGKKD